MPIGVESYERAMLPARDWRALYEASSLLLDHLFEALEALQARPSRRGSALPAVPPFLAEYLPARYRHRYDERFVRQFLVCAASVGLKLRLPGFHPLGCTGEELALHVMEEVALESLELDGHEADEGRFADWHDLALEDEDFLLLYDPERDGAEDPEAAEARFAGYANLDFQHWFTPFNPPRLVHPYLGNEAEQPWRRDREHYDPPGSHTLQARLRTEQAGGRSWSPADQALARMGLKHTPDDYLSYFERQGGGQLFFFWSHETGEASVFTESGGWHPQPVVDGAAPRLWLTQDEACDIFWVEEPALRHDEPLGLAVVAQHTRIPVAGAEGQPPSLAYVRFSKRAA